MTQLALVDEGRNSAYSVILCIQYNTIGDIITVASIRISDTQFRIKKNSCVISTLCLEKSANFETA